LYQISNHHKEEEMAQGKLIVFEGIYGSGRLIVNLVEKLREKLVSQGRNVYEIDSPDSGRAQLMGAQDLDCGWRYGLFKPDFFFELASRARVCSVIRPELQRGSTVLCKSFTVSSVVYARLKGHDWFREDLNGLEARARGLQFSGEVVPDLTVFLDVAPESGERQLGEKLTGYFVPADLVRQRQFYLEELAHLPADKVRIIDTERDEDAVFADALTAIQAILP
jgi:thymidylate kinase